MCLFTTYFILQALSILNIIDNTKESADVTQKGIFIKQGAGVFTQEKTNILHQTPIISLLQQQKKLCLICVNYSDGYRDIKYVSICQLCYQTNHLNLDTYLRKWETTNIYFMGQWS